MIRVRTIGAAEVAVGRRKVTPRTEVMFALALYLGVRAGERHDRDALVGLLWPGKDLAKSRHALRQMMYRLRQQGLAFDETAEDVCLPGDAVRCDVAAVLAPGWPETADAAALAAATSFLPGFNPTFSSEYREWLDELRSRVAAQVRRGALRHIQDARREGRWADLDRWGRLVLALDPLNEEATLARAECAAMIGSKAMALEILDEYLEELGDRSRQIGLPATVLRRRIAETSASWSSQQNRRLPLVGRTDEMRRLTTAVSQARDGSGAAILIEGAPGIGKTRLVEELKRYTHLDGARTLTVQSTSADTGRPYSVGTRIATLLLDTPGVAGCTPAAFAVLKRLGADGFAVSPLDGLAAQSLAPDALSWALSEALIAACVERTLVLILEDLHHCDEESLAAIVSMAHAARALRAVVVATARPAWATRMRNASPPVRAFVPMGLGPLSQVDSHELLDEFALASSREIPDATRGSLVAAAGGNPLFLRELAAQRLASPSAQKLPQSLQDLIATRTGSFTLEEVRLLRIITLLGPLATAGRLRRLLTHGTEKLSDLVERLAAEGILGVQSAGRLSLHECWQLEIQSRLPEAAMAPLAIDCAEVLLDSEDTEDSLDAQWRSAELFSMAGERPAARRSYQLVGEQLMQRGNAHSATIAFSRALSLTQEAKGQILMAVHLAGALHASSEFSHTVELCRRSLSSAPHGTAGTASARALLLALLADAELKSGIEHRNTLNALARAIAEPDTDDDVRQEASMYALRLIFTDAHNPLASDFIAISRAAAERSGLTAFGALAEVIWASERSSANEVRIAESRLQHLRSEHLSPVVQSLALRTRGQSLRFLGDVEQARIRFEAAIAVAEAHGLIRELTATELALTFMLLDHAELDEARNRIGRLKEQFTSLHGYDLRRSLLHAEARLLLQEGKHEAVIEHYSAHLDSLLSDTARRRRIQDLACIALSAAAIKRPDLAIAARTAVEELLSSQMPALQFDFAADCMFALAAATNGGSASEPLSLDYCRRRAEIADRPVPPGFLFLTRAMAEQTLQ